MNTIQINGVTIQVPSGSNVSVINGKVVVDGREAAQVGSGSIIIDAGEQPIRIECDRDVTVNGPVSHGVKAGGTVTCGNVTGGVETSGDVACKNVTGGIEGRDVKCSGNVTGGIEAKNFSR